jgi:hypothetical protein
VGLTSQKAAGCSAESHHAAICLPRLCCRTHDIIEGENADKGLLHAIPLRQKVNPLGGNIMKRFAVLAAVPLFAGFLCAQTESQTTTTTTKTYNGTLVDAGCYTTRVSQHKETSTDANGTTTTRTEKSVSTECPVTTTTTQFGVVAPSGEYVQFDQPSSERVVEMVKKHHKWNTYITEKKPITVRVIGTPNGNMFVVREIQ